MMIQSIQANANVNLPQPTSVDPAANRAQLAAQETSKSAAQAVSVSVDAVQASKASEDTQSAAEAVKELNKFMETMGNSSLQFSIDEDTNIKLVKLIDMQSKEVIRQFPSQEVLTIAKAIDQFRGMLIKDTA